MIDEILKYNKEFVDKKGYEEYKASKFPNKKIGIVTCMDTRLTKLLPEALGLKNGDAKIIKNAGAIITHPFGSAMRSLLIGIYELNIEEIFVIGHTDCGAKHTDSNKMIDKMLAKGIEKKNIDMVKYYGVDLDGWLEGFHDLETSIHKSVEMIKHHPLVPSNIMVYGLIIDSETGALTRLK